MTNTETIQSLIDSGEGYNVEFKVRVPSKVRELTEEICAFANADGGYLLIGVDDNGQIIGTSLENDKRSAIQGSISEISPALHCDMYAVNIEDKTVWVIDVPSGKDKPYIFSGSIFVREGANSQKLRTVEEMRSFFQECNKIFFDAIPCSWFNIYTDADEQAIKDFRTEAQLSPSTADKQIFENLELFTDKGVAKNGAAMFFGKQPERKFPHAVTRCVLFKGTTKVYIIDDKTFGGPLYQQYLQAMAWLESKLQVAYKIEGAGPREEIWEIPLTVFKEAIINALSHRDYYEQGATITIEMFDDRVEVSNPGGLLPIVAKDFGHKSMTRNPLIFGLFTRMHLVERVASGIPRIQEAMKEANATLLATGGATPNKVWQEGDSQNAIYAVPSLGIDPSNGRELFLKKSGEVTYTWDARDRVFCGVDQPDYRGNINTMFMWRDLSVNLSFGYEWGGQQYNSTLINRVENADKKYNVDRRVYEDRWKEPFRRQKSN